MTVFVTSLRRLLWMVLLAAAGGAAYAYWRDSQSDDSLAPAEWPPLEPQSDTAPPVARSGDVDGSDPEAAAAGESTTSSDSSVDTAPSTDVASGTTGSSDTSSASGTSPSETRASSGTATASFVNSLVDAPEARSTDGVAGGWVEPLDDGSCPISHPIKANDNSGIFHLPDGRFYERTKAERCYASPEAATADGYRQAKN